MRKCNRIVRKVVTGVIMLSCIFTTPVSAEQIQTETQQSDTKRDVTGDEVQDFIDCYFNENMKKYSVPGAAVVVVKDGKELVNASYGYKDLETKEPVTKDTTFPACSVSKLFTATAIMQLYEQGKIDLTEDISAYVPQIKIKNSFDEKITCQQLLTHSSGLDEQSELNGSTLDRSKMKSQQAYFDSHIPTVIHEPGTVSCYSNMGYNILGDIVEEVSGQSYEAYVQQHILTPLQMKQSSVRVEDDNMAQGYVGEQGAYEAQPFAYQYTSGSSGIIATSQDMEHFMRMHLTHGSYQGISVLGEATEKSMQKKQFANNDVFDGMGYGWIRTSYGGINVIKHEGALPGYATTMFLIPEEHIGIYVATNSTTGICFDFEDAYMKYFYGDEAVEGAGVSQASRPGDENSKKVDLSKYTGTYRSYDGISQKNLMKIGILFDTTDMQVTKKDADTLNLSYYDQKKEPVHTTLKYYEDGIFVRGDGKGYLTFASKKGSDSVSYAFTQVSHCTYEKIMPTETKRVLAAGGSSFLILFAGAVFMLVKIVRKRYYNPSEKLNSIVIATGQLLTVSCAFASICLAIGMVYSYHYALLFVLNLLMGAELIGAVLMFAGTLYGIAGSARLNLSKKYIVRNCFFIPVQIISIIELYYFHLLAI